MELKPSSINIEDREIIFRTLKKRKFDNQGRIKLPQYRAVPVPENVIDKIDLVFDLRRKRQIKKLKDVPLWDMSRATAWRMIKRVMKRAGIEGKQATSKGLRHGFGIAMLTGDRPAPLNIVRDLMGHFDTKITEIYLQATGKEKRDLVMKAWE